MFSIERYKVIGQEPALVFKNRAGKRLQIFHRYTVFTQCLFGEQMI